MIKDTAAWLKQLVVFPVAAQLAFLKQPPGIYAVGDVISKKYRQITTAVADGTIAAMAIAKEMD